MRVAAAALVDLHGEDRRVHRHDRSHPLDHARTAHVGADLHARADHLLQALVNVLDAVAFDFVHAISSTTEPTCLNLGNVQPHSIARAYGCAFTLALLLALIIAGIYLVYQNSYTSMINKGYRAIQSGDYDQAENYFDRAVRKDRSRPDAYTGYAEMYIDQDDLESAEDVFLTAIETQPTNAQLYEAAIAFYMDTEQPEKVSALLEDCEDENVLSSVSEYISSAPVFSPEAGTYNEVQEVTITSDTGGDIYYTTDGSDPTAETGTKYEEPILLQTEGDTEIRAIAVNAAGIPSIVSSASYKIEFPIVNAPAVTPSTGQYTEPAQITITVPDGYTAYYTMDGSTPDPGSSSTKKYTGPVDMPENTQTIFNAILVNDQNGKATEVTTRNYITTD